MDRRVLRERHDEDVAWLEVSVDDAAAVKELQALCDVAASADLVLGREDVLFLLKCRVKAAERHELCDDAELF